MPYCPLTKDYVDDCGYCEMCPESEVAEEETCCHLTDTFVMNEKFEYVCPKCHPELL